MATDDDDDDGGGDGDGDGGDGDGDGSEWPLQTAQNDRLLLRHLENHLDFGPTRVRVWIFEARGTLELVPILTCICVYVCMCVCLYVYMCICVYVCMCVCLYLYMCICAYVYMCNRYLGRGVLPHGRAEAQATSKVGFAFAARRPQQEGLQQTQRKVRLGKFQWAYILKNKFGYVDLPLRPQWSFWKFARCNTCIKQLLRASACFVPPESFSFRSFRPNDLGVEI